MSEWRSYMKKTLRLGILALFIATVFVSVSHAQPAMSGGGEQLLPLTYDECMNRAKQAFVGEGWVNIGGGGAFVQAFKGIHGAYIMCNVAPENKVWANIVVASSSNDAGVPGAERVNLQRRMNQSGGVAAVGGTLMGDWDIKCCNDALAWTLSIAKHDGNTFSGTFSAAHGGGVVINGHVRGNTIEFDRVESIGGGWKQHWSAQIVNEAGRLRMINGVWTGDYLDRYPGRNNWHAGKK